MPSLPLFGAAPDRKTHPSCRSKTNNHKWAYFIFKVSALPSIKSMESVAQYIEVALMLFQASFYVEFCIYPRRETDFHARLYHLFEYQGAYQCARFASPVHLVI